jgi:hypothetical protein
MPVKISTIYECDRCGHETEHKDDRRSYEAGSAAVSIKSQFSGMALGGDWGGTSWNKDAWLCLDCKKSLKEWWSLPRIQEKPDE